MTCMGAPAPAGNGQTEPEYQQPENQASKMISLDQQSTAPVSQSQQSIVSSSLASFIPALSSPASITGSAQTSNSAGSSSAASISAASMASSTSSCSTCDVCLSYDYSLTATPNVLDDDVNLKKRQGVSRFEKRARVNRNGIRDTKVAKKHCTVSTLT